MKKRILNISLILLLGSTGSVLAQQGIGTNRPDKSAAVDIKSTNKGLLIPRMELSWDGAKISAPTIDSPAQGLLVYNLTTATNVPEGFYYFSNDLWNPIGVSELEDSETTIITGNGTASLPYQVHVKTADTTTLGVVQIGSGINVNNGVISVPAAPGETTTYLNFDSTTTNLTYLSEDTSTSSFTLNLGDVIRGNQNNSTVTGNSPIKIDSSTVGRNTNYNVSVDTATTTTLGVVKPGTGITVTADGTLNVLPQADTATTITNTVVGHKIADYTNELNTVAIINETITKIDFDSATSKLTYTPENGVANNIELNLATIDTDAQQLRLDSNTLTLDRSASVDLTKYLDNTDNQSLSFDSSTNVLSITGDSSTVNLSGLITKLDTGTNTTLTGNGTETAPYEVGVNTANGTNLGVVMQGTNTTIVNGAVNVATADSNTLGVVQIGSGINVSNGVISVPAAPGETTTLIANTLTKGNKQKIADYKNETTNTPVDIFETITSITYDTATNVTHINENTSTVVFNLGDEVRKNQKTTTVVGNGAITVNPTSPNAIGDTAYTVSVDTATTTTLGVVKPGTGITVTADGTLNVLPQADTITTLTGVKTTGNAIGTYKNEAGTDVVINETITSIKFDSATTTLTYTPENGVANNIELNLGSIDTDKQQLRLDSNTLTLDRSASVDLTKYLDNTDNQSLSFDTSLHVLKITGDTNTIDFSNYKNKVYTLASDSNTISLLADGTLADSETVVKTVALELNGKNLTAKVNGVANTTALDLSVLNTDNQYLTFDTTTLDLGISGDTRTVNLSGLVTKLDTGTNTTLVGNGTIANPYKVGVNIAKNNTVTLTGDTPVVNNDGVLGLVKPNEQFNVTTDGTMSIKYAMPQFFYMPSIVIPTDVISAPGSADLEIKLYDQYIAQFNVPETKMRSTNAPIQIPVLPAATDLYYYVTYSDPNSIEITGIDANGDMTYRVLNNTNSLSFINIVFVIK